VGRTFSYSDTQRYRVGPNYLQLPVNRPREDVKVNTNQTGGQMSYGRDFVGDNPHINYEPSFRAGLREADTGPQYQPFVSGPVGRIAIERKNPYKQAGQRWRGELVGYEMTQQEKDDLVLNFTTLLSECDKGIQERMVWHFRQCDQGLGNLVADGLGLSLDSLPDFTEEYADRI
jgi:catalase